MGGQKQKKNDFQKVKLKVGRTVNRGLNFTDTSFKSKKIALRTQLKESSTNIKDQYQLALNKIGSSNTGVLLEGLQTLNRIINPLPPDKRQIALQRVGILFSHVEVSIRMGATSIVNRILESFTLEQREALSNRLILNLQSSLTSLDWAVKVDGLVALNMLFKHIPHEIAKNHAILENVLDLVSLTREGSTNRRLNVELQCRKNHLKLWSDVCDLLTKIILQLMKTFNGDGNRQEKSCSGMTTLLPRVRWSSWKAYSNSCVVQLNSSAIANDILPLLLEMWSGVESFEIKSGSEQIKYDSFAKISLLMLTVTEWADMCQTKDFKTLPDQVLNFFKGRYPLKFDSGICSTVNLRIAKFLITIHGGKHLALNRTLFEELKKNSAPSDTKLLLDVAARAMADSPEVIEYVNSLFFTRKGQLRRPFYDFYLKACNEIIGNKHMNQMLLKMPSFICKIILQYPTMCSDEIAFLDRLHSFMLPAYIDGIGSLSLSTLEQVLRLSHAQSRLALRLILDQAHMRGDHMKIILDFWYEGSLTDDDVTFVVGHLAWKLDEVWTHIVQEPNAMDAIVMHIQHVNLISEFSLSVYLDLDENQRPRSLATHLMQPKMQYFQLIHNSTLKLKNVTSSQVNMYAALRHFILRDEKLRHRVSELIWILLQAWEYTESSLEMSSLTLSNMILLMNDLKLFGEDVIDPLDKLVNQLVVAQFLAPMPDRKLLESCAEYYKVYGTESFIHDLDQVMNADPEDCDDRLHTAFAKSAKMLRDLKVLQRNDLHLDHLEDAMRLAEEDSADGPSSPEGLDST